MVIPAMDHIDWVLASQSVNRTFDAPIRVALALGKKTLNCYYALTDSSEVYRIAMSMEGFTVPHTSAWNPLESMTLIHCNPMESMGLPWIPVDSMDSMGFHNSKIPKVLWTIGNL
jgi:hypothetical protein